MKSTHVIEMLWEFWMLVCDMFLDEGGRDEQFLVVPAPELLNSQ